MMHETGLPGRFGHVAVRFDHYILVTGGFDAAHNPLSHHEVWMYNLYTLQWQKHVISESQLAPPSLYCWLMCSTNQRRNGLCVHVWWVQYIRESLH